MGVGIKLGSSATAVSALSPEPSLQTSYFLVISSNVKLLNYTKG